MRPSIRILALSFLTLVVICCVGPDLLLVPFTLLFGWLNALRRVVSSITANPGALAWAGLALVLIVLGTHWFGLWLWQRLLSDPVSDDGSRVAPRWRWRWTLTFHAMLAAVLFAAMSVVGVAHQTGWLIASREPIYVSRTAHIRDRAEMRYLASAIETAGVEQQWDTAAIRRGVWGTIRDGGEARERLHTVFLEGTNNRLARALIFPRNPKTFARTGVGIVEPDAPFRTAPAETLTSLLQVRSTAAQAAATAP